MPISRQIKAIINDISGKREVKKIAGRDLVSASKSPLNKAYCFHYPDPVTKSRLDYWMVFPVIVILHRAGNRVLALNLQHLTYTYSLNLAELIAKKIRNKKRSIKYGDIKEAVLKAKIPKAMLYFALRSYRVDKISGNVYVLNMDEYVSAMKLIPRKSSKMGLSAAIKLNMSRYYNFIKKQKMKNKGNK